MRLLQYPLDSSTGVIRPLPLGEAILVSLGAQDTLAQYSPYFGCHHITVVIHMALMAVEPAERDLGYKEPTPRTLLTSVVFVESNHQIPQGMRLIRERLAFFFNGKT